MRESGQYVDFVFSPSNFEILRLKVVLCLIETWTPASFYLYFSYLQGIFDNLRALLGRGVLSILNIYFITSKSSKALQKTPFTLIVLKDNRL